MEEEGPLLSPAYPEAGEVDLQGPHGEAPDLADQQEKVLQLTLCSPRQHYDLKEAGEEEGL